MTFQIPQENSTVIPVSFGIGLLLAGRYILGTAAIAIDKLSSIDTWYYSKDGETVGPLGEGAILHLFKSNKIAKNTFIYNSVISNEWIPFEQTHLYLNQVDKS